MKKDIHPKYYDNAKVKCSCGNVFEIGSTLEEINVEVCSACHPFYTGKKKTLDVEGRIEKFKRRMEAKKELTPKKKKQRKQKDDKKIDDKKENKREEKKIIKKTIKKVSKKEDKKTSKKKETTKKKTTSKKEE